MKKSLVALAAVAATGAFAQVTITGTLAMGWEDTQVAAAPTTAAATKAFTAYTALAGGSGGGYTQTGNTVLPAGEASGFGVDQSTQLNFAAAEDLGGGYKTTAKMQLSALDRGQGVQGGDTSLALLTPVGQLTVFNAQNTDYLSRGYAAVGAPTMDNKVFNPAGYLAGVNFATKVGPVIVGLTHAEAPTAKTISSTTFSLGGGESGTNGLQRLTSISATYSNGPLSVDGQYISYDNQTFIGAIGCDCSYNNIVRARGAYDMGIAKLGGGYQVVTLTSGATATMSLLAASVPVGAMTFAADYAQLATSGTAGNLLVGLTGNPAAQLGANSLDGTRGGYGLSATYAFSKTTSASVQYTNWLYYSTNLSGSASTNNTQTEVLLTKSF